ncbi:DNA-processing protein DprA [Paenisporosarcina sp. TG-14]|uniref:DNA-processing protein DprA n=1 Tax=Paenisporosarcina sp. TG-14 TaxID=1231057 RepID=UPI0002E37675|nr:DNA-processing protein DprA [Paenisporosarcina sp. TG-14]
MDNQSFHQRLLALHYVMPIPLNRLKPLLQVDPDLVKCERMNIHQLSQLLKLTYDRAQKFKVAYAKALGTPLIQAYKTNNITPLPFNHPNYPKQLSTLYDPPTILYAKGRLDYLLMDYFVAVIGARDATDYSKDAMAYILPPLVKHDMVIVSGLAKGADAMAHQLTHELGGKTIGVLGHGHFHRYPKENLLLYDIMEKHHLTLSEYPPYVTSQKWYFPMRNRLISGLSQAVVVTEAKEKSGTVITLQHALDNGKDVYCVPGPITSMLSLGPNQSLLEGAKPVWNGFQIVEELQSRLFQK